MLNVMTLYLHYSFKLKNPKTPLYNIKQIAVDIEVQNDTIPIYIIHFPTIIEF